MNSSLSTPINTPTNTPASVLNNSANAQKAKASKQVTESAATPAKQNSKAGTSDSVSFSNRAVKIQSIASEFFSDDGLSIADIPRYVQRLKSDGFLTEQQAEKLGASTVVSSNEITEASAKVINFLDDFKSTVSDSEGNDSLITLLDKTKSALESLGSMSSKTTATNLKMIDMELKDYLKSDQAKQWLTQDLDSLEQFSGR
jgi:hypothetical protein